MAKINMAKCSTCGKHVKLRKENRYEVVIKAEAWQKSFGAKDRLDRKSVV